MKWTNRYDALPINGMNVIVYYINSVDECITIGCFYDHDGWYDINGNPIATVTHWMPLPEKPE